MIFPCPYGLFGWVGTVHVGGGVLEVSMLGADECFHLVGCFIVQFAKLRFEPLLYKSVVHLTVCSEEFFLGSVLDGDQSDVVGIVYVEDDYVHVAPICCDQKSVLFGHWRWCP